MAYIPCTIYAAHNPILLVATRIQGLSLRAHGDTCSLLTHSPTLHVQQEASVRGQLYMDTFRRLNLGLVLQTGATLVVAAQAVSLRNPLLTGMARLLVKVLVSWA